MMRSHLNHQTVLLTHKDAAKRLRVSAKWLHHYRDTFKVLPAIKLGRRIYYRQYDLDIWLHQHRHI